MARGGLQAVPAELAEVLADPASHRVRIGARGICEGTEHLVPQGCIEVDSIRSALENHSRWVPDLERICNGLEQPTPDAQTMKRRFDDSLLDPGMLSEPSMDLGDVLVKLPVDGEESIVGQRLARNHPTKPALPRRASHDDADQHVAHVSAQNDGRVFTP